MIRKDRRRASTDARLELRRQLVELRAMGKTMVEISAIRGERGTRFGTNQGRRGYEVGDVLVGRPIFPEA